MKKYLCLVVMVVFSVSFCLPGFAEEPTSFQQSSQKYMQAQEVYQMAKAESGDERVQRTEIVYRNESNFWDGYGKYLVVATVISAVALIAVTAISANSTTTYRVEGI